MGLAMDRAIELQQYKAEGDMDVAEHKGTDGYLYQLTQGDYSDFIILGLFHSPTKVDLAGCVEGWCRDHPEQAGILGRWKANDFRRHAIESLGLKPMDMEVAWLGSEYEEDHVEIPSDIPGGGHGKEFGVA